MILKAEKNQTIWQIHFSARTAAIPIFLPCWHSPTFVLVPLHPILDSEENPGLSEPITRILRLFLPGYCLWVSKQPSLISIKGKPLEKCQSAKGGEEATALWYSQGKLSKKKAPSLNHWTNNLQVTPLFHLERKLIFLKVYIFWF